MPMDSDRINSLLNKYWACETTLEEESELREYFSEGQFPEQLRETAHLFRYFSENKSNAISDVTFDRQVIDRINAGKQGKIRKLFYNTMRIAAGVAVLVVATWFVRNEIRNNNPETAVVDTYSDPKLAFEETKKALMMISKSFGTAEEEAKKINLFNEAQEVVKKEEENGNTNL